MAFTFKYRLAGAQIPVSAINIQRNKKEIIDALDWAAENKADHLLTPEAALSGWSNYWLNDVQEVKDALTEVEEHQKKVGVGLHLGTLFQEKEQYGVINRNQIRHYSASGEFMGATNKTQVVHQWESALGRNPEVDRITIFPMDDNKNIPAAGMICNDMFGGIGDDHSSIAKDYGDQGIPMVFHATNGRSVSEDDYEYTLFDQWHDAHFRMNSRLANLTILTVDSCTPWTWDGEDEDAITQYPTSSQSGIINGTGWLTTVPRYGRQYFVGEVELK